MSEQFHEAECATKYGYLCDCERIRQAKLNQTQAQGFPLPQPSLQAMEAFIPPWAKALAEKQEAHFAAIVGTQERIEKDHDTTNDAMCHMQNAMMAMLHKVEQAQEAHFSEVMARLDRIEGQIEFLKLCDPCRLEPPPND